jgi:hypothetical protein
MVKSLSLFNTQRHDNKMSWLFYYSRDGMRCHGLAILRNGIKKSSVQQIVCTGTA